MIAKLLAVQSARVKMSPLYIPHQETNCKVGTPESAVEANMMEHGNGLKRSLTGNTVHMTMHPYEINTI
jgi:hypothetical protein